MAAIRSRVKLRRSSVRGGRRLGLALGLLAGVFLAASCAVDFTNPNVPGGGNISCNPTETQINYFYDKVLLEELVGKRCRDCHSAETPAGSYGFSMPADATDATGKKDSYCYHFTKWEDNTLIDYPTSPDHVERGGSENRITDLPNLADWVRNRFQ